MLIAHAGGGLEATPALALGLGLIGATVAYHRGTAPRGRTRTGVLLLVAGAALAFQMFHLAEHVLQAGYWLSHPSEAPWLTPWAGAGRDVLAGVAGGSADTGAELLHLVGNTIFLAGLLAAVAVVRRGDAGPSVWLRRATMVQTAHVAEHVALTTTLVLGGRAVGATTLLGLLAPGTAVLHTTRVWSHFAINAVATVLAVLAVRDLRPSFVEGRGVVQARRIRRRRPPSSPEPGPIRTRAAATLARGLRRRRVDDPRSHGGSFASSRRRSPPP